MTGRSVLTAIGPSCVRRYRIRLLRGHRQSNAQAALDKPAPKQSATWPAAWQRPLRDAENFGGGDSFEPPSPFTSLEHFVGAAGEGQRDSDAKRLGGLEVQE